MNVSCDCWMLSGWWDVQTSFKSQELSVEVAVGERCRAALPKDLGGVLRCCSTAGISPRLLHPFPEKLHGEECWKSRLQAGEGPAAVEGRQQGLAGHHRWLRATEGACEGRESF